MNIKWSNIELILKLKNKNKHWQLGQKMVTKQYFDYFDFLNVLS